MKSETLDRPARATLLPYSRQSVSDADIQAVTAVLRSDFLTCGPAVAALEAKFAATVGARHAVAVSNGTAALHAAMASLGLGPGDEVIVPPLTFVATANCVRYCGATVVFADVRRDTLTLSPEAVGAAITPRTRAIVAVDFCGCPADYKELGDLARRHGLALIADAAHSLGATYQALPVGSLADLSTFSLHAVKHITGGEGGVVATASAETAAFLRSFRSHGISSDFHRRAAEADWVYDQALLGYNYRLTDFQCALAGSQLDRLPQDNLRRRELVESYRRALGGMAEIELPTVPADRESAWHLFVVRLQLKRLHHSRGDIFRAMRRQNIGVNVHYVPVPWHSYYQGLAYRRGNWPVAESEYERLLTLPLWPGMTEDDVLDTVQALQRALV